MTSFGCPGQEKRNLKIDAIKCQNCGEEIEFFSDEIKRKCPQCKAEVVREVMPSCVDWCRYAKDCVGQKTFDEYMQDKGETIKKKLLKDLEVYFGSDEKRINHAKRVLQFAEEILKHEGGDWHIVVPASILHDVGIKKAEEKCGSNSGHCQEKEGPAIAKKILLKNGLQVKDIDEICEIIAHHHTPGKVDTLNFKILYDADWLVNLKDEVDLSDKNKLKEIINKVFLTKKGRETAEKIYLSD